MSVVVPDRIALVSSSFVFVVSISAYFPVETGATYVSIPPDLV